MIFTESIGRIRELYGLKTYAEVAFVLGITLDYLNKCKAGTRTPSQLLQSHINLLIKVKS